MVVIQEVFDVPEKIAIGLATGKYKRYGGVIRWAAGPQKGRIVKCLKPVVQNDGAQMKGVAAKAAKFAAQHKKGVGIVAGAALVGGVAYWGYEKWKNREPKELKKFRKALGVYIQALQSGKMNTEIIVGLQESIEELKNRKDYKNLYVKLTADQLDVLVSRIWEYTEKLAADNEVKLSVWERKQSKNIIDSLSRCLEAQIRIFEAA